MSSSQDFLRYPSNFSTNMKFVCCNGMNRIKYVHLITLLMFSSFLSTKAFMLQPLHRVPRVHAINNLNVASAALHDEKGNENNDMGEKLSRPERKALERAKKRANANHRKHNYAERSDILRESVVPAEGRYNLHSKRVSKLSRDSTAEDVVKAIKRAQNLHDVHDVRAIEKFLLEEAPKSFAYGYFGSLLSRLAVAALHLNEQRVARRVLDMRRQDFGSSVLPMESAAIIRGLLRVHNVSDAFQILNEELDLPPQDSDLTSEESRELIKHRALSLGSIASRHFFESEPALAVQACQLLTEIGPIVRNAGLTAEDVPMPWARIVQGAAQCDLGRREGRIIIAEDTNTNLPCNLVYSVLNAMTTFPSANDDKTYEVLSNSLIRRVVFITAATEMKGCPESDRGEAVFIGRSNVGKSSLVNMITNRKSLAYTSKTPGKTQTFNFFAVNDKPEREREVRYGDVVPGAKDPDSFYLVDVPGFGFAKVPENKRQEWSLFLNEYISTRKTLRVVFHLIDSRHGPTTEDSRIMNEFSQILPQKVTYVVVLTKADKNVKGVTKKNEGKVSRDVMESLRKTMKKNMLGKVPVILTSAETKLGRDDLWRYLKLAAEV